MAGRSTGELVRTTADGVVLWRSDTGPTEEVAAARVSKVMHPADYAASLREGRCPMRGPAEGR